MTIKAVMMKNGARECNCHIQRRRGRSRDSVHLPGTTGAAGLHRRRNGAKGKKPKAKSPGRGVVRLIIVSALGQRDDLIRLRNRKDLSGS